jgi:hypothetical protein
MCGTVQRKPQVAPEALSMTLFGPGPHVMGTAKAVTEAIQVSVDGLIRAA